MFIEFPTGHRPIARIDPLFAADFDTIELAELLANDIAKRANLQRPMLLDLPSPSVRTPGAPLK